MGTLCGFAACNECVNGSFANLILVLIALRLGLVNSSSRKDCPVWRQRGEHSQNKCVTHLKFVTQQPLLCVLRNRIP